MMHDPRPFTAASNKLAYAQAFSRDTRHSVTPAPATRTHRGVLTALLHRSAR